MSAADAVGIAWTGAPAHVRGVATVRGGPGVSRPPFDAFNLGLRSGDDAAAVHANRAALAAALDLPSAPRWLAQVHGDAVVRFDGTEPEGAEPVADASVTAVPGVVLAILTADCLPVLFAARDGREIGAAHAGWRGLAGGVLEATLAALRTPPAGLVAWLGPAAGPRHYEIGAEVRDAFLAHDAGAAAAFEPTRPGHWHMDIYALARARLAAAGVLDVQGGGLCTIGDAARFYSYRRDGRTGRMATLAWMEAAAP
jgi:YfiH family protein